MFDVSWDFSQELVLQFVASCWLYNGFPTSVDVLIAVLTQMPGQKKAPQNHPHPCEIKVKGMPWLIQTIVKTMA